MPIVSLLTWCISDADALPRPVSRAAPVTPTSLRNWRLLDRAMVIPLIRSVRKFFCHHNARADSGSGRQANNTGSQRIGSFPLVLEIDRCITVERRRFVNLDLVGNRGFKEQVRFGAADAGVTDADRPGNSVVEADDRTVGIGCRPFAPQFVEAVPFGMGRITIRFGKTAGIEMGPALAMFVNLAAVGKFGTSQMIQFGQFGERHIMQHGGEEIVRIRGASGDVDDRLVLDDITNADRTGRIGTDGLDPAVTGAGADGNYRGGAIGSFSQRFECSLATHLAVDAVIPGRNGALDHQDILPLVGL